MYVKYLPILSPDGLLVLLKHIFGVDGDAKIFGDNFNLYDKGWNIVTNSRDAKIDAPQAYGRHIAKRSDETGVRLRRQESFEAIYGMIDLCRKIGASPILVTVPYTRDYTDFIRKNDPEFSLTSTLSLRKSGTRPA